MRMNNTSDVEAREHWGAVRIDGAFHVRVAGRTIAVLTGPELGLLAQGLAFKLEARAVVAGPSGIVAEVGDTATVHLAYTHDYDSLVGAVRAAAAELGVTV